MVDISRIIELALAEDVGEGDIATNLTIPESQDATLSFVTREDIVVCGIPFINQIYDKLSGKANFIKCEPKFKEGEIAKAGSVLATASGNARTLLTGERVALNIIQRASGVATITRKYVDAIRGTGVTLLDTRKTMPALRVLDKYSTQIGGAKNHRMRLDDGIIIKDNHIAIAGSITQAVARVKAGSKIPVEVECDNLEQVNEAVNSGADIIMLDNMSIKTIEDAIKMINGKAKVEVSGNINLDNIRAYALKGVDYISVGKITHSAPAVDIGLDYNWNYSSFS